MNFQRIASYFKNRRKRILKRIIAGLAISIGLFLTFLVLDYVFPFDQRLDYSTLVIDSNGDILNAYLSNDDKWRLYLEQEDITEELKKAILFKEDQYFYSHPGVNPISIVRAFVQNITSGKRKSGASTITMQVSRLLNPKERTYGNKIVEMFNALQLEYHCSKDDILRLYLNLLPYGGNIEGIKSASHIYFGKDPKLLSLAELAGLVAIPNRPSSLSIKNDHAPINQAKDKWLKRFQVANVFQSHIIDLAMTEELKPKRRDLPNHAPHLSRRLKANTKNKIIKTYLEYESQKRIEEIASAHINRLKYLNVTNTSIIVIENKTRRVISYVGSANFYDEQSAGQVDGVSAIRSPGSTLKPLLYALHYDKGNLSPKRRIADVQMSFGGYEPENYDNTFHGWISSEEALRQSLNVPTVQLLNDYGISKFIEPLVRSQFRTIERTKNKLGLSLILGGCGVSLKELAGLYSAFANAGNYQPLQFYKNVDSTNRESPIVSEQAAYILTEILTEVTRPDLPDSWKDNPNRPRIAWKTGTSFGRRDAWSIGYNQEYTVGVWAGNFSGEGAPELSGVGVAAPILFDVFNVIADVSTYDWYERPPGVDRVLVCDETGLTPNTFCTNTVVDQVIEGVTIPSLCQHLKPVLIAPDSSESYCMTCVKDAEEYKEALFSNHSAELLDYFKTEKITYTKAPDHYKFCERVFPDQGLEIVSPVDRLEYYVDADDEKQIQLKAQSPSNTTRYFWYINDVFYKSVSRNEEIYFTPSEGKIKISCSDDRGRNQNITISVKKVSF
ncbi:penicillin-binding protein 1C [Ekhidna sp.]|uniref:penicillin-binding protein 1C n=1 Tax=Ekhidna sp. TaxID=2608089 RepID=UPI003299501A